MNKQKTLIIQLCMNTITLLGVIFYNWSVFALIYLYWLETLGFVFFNSIKILTAKNHFQNPPHLKMSFIFLLFNVGILLFYLIFIITFIGIVVSGKQEGKSFVTYLCLLDSGFRYTVFSFFSFKFFELAYYYFYKGEYKTASPSHYHSFFNPRIIMIHVVIILGFFTFKYFSENFDNKYGLIGFASVFVILKSIADVVSIYVFNNKVQKNSEFTPL